ncbi:hypothetical protein AGMMS49556_00780 [Endomicrobiia bacterium]|nr:hypothetical protein AGMMS49556_00780 [Endomicrobiia bacterium]
MADASVAVFSGTSEKIGDNGEAAFGIGVFGERKGIDEGVEDRWIFKAEEKEGSEELGAGVGVGGVVVVVEVRDVEGVEVRGDADDFSAVVEFTGQSATIYEHTAVVFATFECEAKEDVDKLGSLVFAFRFMLHAACEEMNKVEAGADVFGNEVGGSEEFDESGANGEVVGVEGVEVRED